MANAGGDKSGLATTAVVVLLLSLMGAAAGFAVGVLLQPGEEKKADAPAPAGTETKPAEPHFGDGEEKVEESPSAEPETEEPPALDLRIIPIPPVLTTLAQPPGKWIRLEGALLVKDGSEIAPEQLAERAGEQVLAYLRTVRLEQLQGGSGLPALRDDLNETVRALSGGAVRGLLIHGLVVE